MIGVAVYDRTTVFPRIDAAAFIYFISQLGAATIRGRRLFEGGVYYFQQLTAPRTQLAPRRIASTSR